MKKHVLQWHITHKCNLRCLHCYQEEYTRDLDRKELEEIFHHYLEFVDYYNYKGHINFTGGEPFISEDIFHMLDLCETSNISFGVLTNGTMLNETFVQKLEKYQKLSFVQISIDGTKETHNHIRGIGSFEKALETFKLLKKYHIQTMAAFTCHKENYQELSQVIKIMKKNKIDRFWMDRLIPMGNNEEETLTTEEYRNVIRFLTKEQEKARKNPLCTTTIHTNRALQFCEGGNEIYQCSAGVELLTILADGTLLPCRRLPIPVGNVLEKSILNLYQNSQVIKNLQKKEIPIECNQCLKAELCRGGAKCLSYALHKDYNRKDENCYISPEHNRKGK